MFQLRPYQDRVQRALKDYLRKSVEPCLIDAAPAAGKSFLIADTANFLYQVSGGKRVLCLAPSKELVEQNVEKFRLTGEPCSIFSASAGQKSTKHKVVYGTPKSVLNSISAFRGGYSGVLVDEAHGTTPTIRAIIDKMREDNPMLRVVGYSGTPFILGGGYIYQIDENGRTVPPDQTFEPYYHRLVARVSAKEMLDSGFITPMRIGEINAERYDTSGLNLNSMGRFNPGDVDRAFVGHGRKTAAIVADVIEKARPYSGGVMLFASTIQHAHEIMASLPPSLSAMVTGEPGKKAERKRIIEAYRRREVRYLVSVGTLTTGFDVPHTQVIALLRKTESAALLQQILGRAWRLHDAKPYSVVFDYADNIEDHFPDGDIYNPVIKARSKKEGGKPLRAVCPSCAYENEFSCREEYKEYPVDENGYCLDAFGNRVETEFGPLPAHYGRRCLGYVPAGRGQFVRCSYRWTGKDCPACGEQNDIAARHCTSCKAEIVDPNEKLIGEFRAMKKDPRLPQCDEVLSMAVRHSVSLRGNKTVVVDWVTPYRRFTTYFLPEAQSSAQLEYARFDKATNGGKEPPKTITYRKVDDKFFRILNYNQPADVEPEKKELIKT